LTRDQHAAVLTGFGLCALTAGAGGEGGLDHLEPAGEAGGEQFFAKALGQIAKRDTVAGALDHAAFGRFAGGGAEEKADGQAKDLGDAGKVGDGGCGLATLNLRKPADRAVKRRCQRLQRHPARFAQGADIGAEGIGHCVVLFGQGAVKLAAVARGGVREFRRISAKMKKYVEISFLATQNQRIPNLKGF
jgi:hypothetical protein